MLELMKMMMAGGTNDVGDGDGDGDGEGYDDVPILYIFEIL